MKNLRAGSQETATHSIPGFDAIAPMALEPRFMFDAAGAATAADSAEQAQADAEAEQATQQESDTPSSNGDSSQSEDTANQPDVPASGSEFDVLRMVDAAQNGGRKEVVFIDGSLTDIDDLIADIGDGVEIIVLDGNADGLDQIVAWAAQNADFDALHIISHGAEGAVYLGNMTLNSETVIARADDLAVIGASITENGDILLYGCRVAGGDGKAFADALALATGADIAASVDDTGASNLGGDWELEYATGALEGMAYSSSYEHLLATDNMDSATASGTTVTSSVDGIGYTIATSSGGSWFEFSGQTVTYTSGGSGTVPFIGGHFWGQATGDGTSYTFTFNNPVNITSIGMLSVSTETGATYVFSDTTSGSSNSNVNVASSSLDGVTMTMGGGYHATNVSLGWTAVSSFTVTLTGGDGNMRLAFDDLIASAAPANNAPTVTGVPTDVTVTEDTASNFDLSAVTFADTDGDSLTVTIAASAGTFAATTSGSVTVGGSGTGTLTLTGTAANINTWLDTTSNIQYTGASNAAGDNAATFTVKANDGTTDSTVSNGNIDITGVDDAPSASGVPSDVTVSEDTASNFDLSAITLTEVDGENLTVTITATAGTFAASSSGSVTVGGSGTGSLTLSGTAANINTWLDTTSNIQYTGASNVSGDNAATFTINANDGTTNPQVGSGNIDITAVNDAPALSGLNGTPSFTEGGSAVVLDADMTVSDLELGSLNGGNGNFAGASVVLVRNGGVNAADIFSMITGGNLTLNGSNIESGGNVIASFDTTSVSGQVTITFQNNGTIPTTALVNEVLQAIRYSNSGNDAAGSVQIDYSFSDGNSGNAQGTGANPGTVTGSVTVSITGVNDAPTLAATGSNPTYIEGAGASDLFSAVTASTVESADRFSEMTLTVTNVSDGAAEIIGFDGTDIALTNGNSVTTATNTLGVSVSVSGSTATISFTGATLTAAQMQTLIDGLSYRNSSDNPTTGSSRVVTITGLRDNGGTANSGADSVAPNIASTVSLTGVNDAPVVGSTFGETSSVTAGSGAQNVTGLDDGTVTNADSADYNGGTLTIGQDSGTANGSWGVDGANVTAGGDGTISGNDTISVGGVAIGTVHAISDGQGGNALEITLNADATSARVQTLLQSMTYSATSGLGDRVFTLTLNDADGTANSGDQDASGTFTISVTPNPPVLSSLSGDSVTAGNNTAVSIDQNGNMTLTDADSANFNGGNLTISRTSGLSGNFLLSGTVTAGGDSTIAAGETISINGTNIGTVTMDGQGSNNLVITFNTTDATPANVQALIRALQYQSTAGGDHTFSTTVSDAAGGSTPATSTAATFTVSVQSVPVNTVPGGQTATDGTAKAITGISVADSDSANVTTTVSVASGAGVFTTTGAATITGGGTNSIQISGTIAAVNATLANLQYTPATDSAGAQTITVLTSDGTNSDSDTITVTVSDRPTVTGLSGDSVNYTAGQTVKLDSGQNATVSDADFQVGAFSNGGTLTVSFTGGGSASQDILKIDTAGTVTLDGTTAGSNVRVNGTVIGTLANGIAAGNNLQINFNTAANLTNVQELVRALAYENSSGTPTAGNRTISVTLSDTNGNSSTVSTVTVRVTAPVVTPTPPPPPPPAPPPVPVVTVPPILQTPGSGGDAGTPVSNALSAGSNGSGSGGQFVSGGPIQTTVTGQLGNTSPIGNSGTPVSAGLSVNRAGSGLGVATGPGGGGGAVLTSGGFGGGFGGIGSIGGSAGLGGGFGGDGPGDAGAFGGGAGGDAGTGTPGGNDGILGAPSSGGEAPGAEGGDGETPTGEGGGDQAMIDGKGEAELAAALDDFSAQLAAFGDAAEMETMLLDQVLGTYRIPA